MSSHLLPIVSANCSYELDRALPFVKAGRLPSQHMPIVWNAFRSRAICDFFLDCRADSLCLGLHKSAAAFLHYLTVLATDAEKATSRSQPLFDAVACADWQTALAIADASRATRNVELEYEEDFLYVWFVIRYLKRAPIPELEATLDRLGEIVVDLQPQLDLCTALLQQRADEFASALERMISVHEARYAEKLDRGLISEERWAVEAPLFVEGMALIRLGERIGFPRVTDYPLIPALAMADPIPVYANDDWWQG